MFKSLWAVCLAVVLGGCVVDPASPGPTTSSSPIQAVAFSQSSPATMVPTMGDELTRRLVAGAIWYQRENGRTVKMEFLPNGVLRVQNQHTQVFSTGRYEIQPDGLVCQVFAAANRYCSYFEWQNGRLTIWWTNEQTGAPRAVPATQI